jgi:hypothetical protein
MVFSTHRFGKLTRSADVIMYVFHSPHSDPHMKLTDFVPTRYILNGVIQETGTHESLLKREHSEYAKIWNLQAQAYL